MENTTMTTSKTSRFDPEFENWLDSIDTTIRRGALPHGQFRTLKALYWATRRANDPYPWPRKLPPVTGKMKLVEIRRALHFLTCNNYHGWNRIKPLLKLIPQGVTKISALILALLLVNCIPGFTQASQIPPDKPQRQYADDDKPEYRKSKPIKTWDKELTIKFANCRENEKHHISCQFRDATGDQHWVCLMGLTEDDMK